MVGTTEASSNTLSIYHIVFVRKNTPLRDRLKMNQKAKHMAQISLRAMVFG